MTHTQKKVYGINGAERTENLILLEQKEPKRPEPQRFEGVQSVGKDEVGGSNPPSSSTKTRCPARDSGFLPFLEILLKDKKD